MEEAGILEQTHLVIDDPSVGETEKPKKGRKKKTSESNGATLGFEASLWNAADKLRSNMDAAEYKHITLGLLFLKYISDAFEERRLQLEAEMAEGADPESPDEYLGAGAFWVPPEARWSALQASAKQGSIGAKIDAAMIAIERENPMLKNVLLKDYGRPTYEHVRFGELIDLIAGIPLIDPEHRSKDLLGRVYEYFLGQFASAEGKKGGQFYTPRCVVETLVRMISPYRGRVYDPCCGSGGMFVQSERFVEVHGGRRDDISVYGQESNMTTWRLAKMNLAIRGIETNLGVQPADSFTNDQHKDLKADFVLANPPFNMKEWWQKSLENDVRWRFGTPPEGNANFAWVQHIIHHLAPTGTAGFVLANGSLSSNHSGEGEIRQRIVEADLVDCVVAMPDKLFYSTPIPACLWFIARDKQNRRLRDRRGEVLFIDARKLGPMIDRRHRELSEEDLERIAGTYHAWRGDEGAGAYEDVLGFCKVATIAEVAAQGFVLTPGRFVGAAAVEDDGVGFEATMARLTAELSEQFAESARLEATIRENLAGLGFGV